MGESIKLRFERVRDEVETVSNRRSWQKGKTRLIVVTKRQNLDLCHQVIEAGAFDIGENYPEEAVEKYTTGSYVNLNFHMIGHLQSRKIKLLDPLFSYLHTIDNVERAVKLSNYFSEKNKCIKGLVEVNFTKEISKNGFRINSEEDKKFFLSSFEAIYKLPGLSICGLMTMGYFPETPEMNRGVFRKCKDLFEETRNKYSMTEFSEISMGTSGDYVTAIEEGATFVRIGELIMGPRPEKVKR